MPKLTLESLAKRIEVIETALASGEPRSSSKNWRDSVGMFAGSDFMKQVDEEGRRIREADREAARYDSRRDG